MSSASAIVRPVASVSITYQDAMETLGRDSPQETTPSRTRPRRTSSLPPPPRTAEADRKSTLRQNRTQHPASPEVIASLIDSLSNISAPAHDYFDHIPQISGSTSTPASPNGLQTDFADFTSRHKENLFLHPNDAAEPPVIRIAKPPSGLSPLTAPKPTKKHDSGSFKGYLRSSTQSTTSLHSTYSAYEREDANSIGNISIEAAPQSLKSKTSSESKRSGRGKGLLYMSSRELLRSKDKRSGNLPSPIEASATTAGAEFEAAAQDQVPAKSQSTPRASLADTPIQEDPTARPTLRSRRRKPPPMKLVPVASAAVAESPATPGGAIPLRRSSLRHRSNSPRNESRRARYSDPIQPNTPIAADFAEEESPVGKGKEKMVDPESSALKRIEELKQKKWRRDNSSTLETPLQPPAAPVLVPVEPTTSDMFPISPPSTSSSFAEMRQHEPDEKARKVLGISPSASRFGAAQTPRAYRETPSVPPAPLVPPRIGPRYHRSKLSQDSVPPLSPMVGLPINYNHVVESLERPSSAVASSKESSSTGSRSSKQQKTRSVGGRSAVSRKATTAALMSSSTSSSAMNNTRKTVSNEYDTPDRHKPLYLSPTNSAGSAPSSTRRDRKSKRWSHPDLPLPMESKSSSNKANNKKGAPPAVQQLPHSIKEDRPASVDSVDLAIQDFINAPRLSQSVKTLRINPQARHHAIHTDKEPNYRRISFSEVGDPQGFAVFCCVGMGLTRYVMSFYDELAKTLKLRLITLDRPGIGGSDADEGVNPLNWPDDIYTICQHLRISKFSLLAHSAGAVYALATALRMPQHIRGRVHLLAPWIPPSQMAPIGVHQNAAPGGQLPRSQRFLRTLPPSLLKIANASFLSTTSASITRSMPKSPKAKRRSTGSNSNSGHQESMMQAKDSLAYMDHVAPNSSALSLAPATATRTNLEPSVEIQKVKSEVEQLRREIMDQRLTLAIWDKATANASPAIDLMVCLEKPKPIGFRYEDITRGVVIHHGSKDTRVPVENVRWLGRIMRRCEVRILEGESHGLMANPIVMGNLLMEVAKEWEDWTAAVEHSARGGTKKGS